VTDNEYINTDDSNESELLPLALLIWSKKIFIGTLFIIGAVVGVVLGLSKTPIYVADALVQLETKNSGITLSEDIADIMSTESEAITEIEIIRSRMVIGNAIESIGLDVVASPRLLPLIGGMVSRSGLERPDWNWLAPYGWRGESLKVDSLQVSPELLNQSVIARTDLDGKYSIHFQDGRKIDGVVGEQIETRDGDFRITLGSISAPAGVEFSITKIALLDAISTVRSSLKITEKGRGSNLLHISMQHKDRRIGRAILEEIVGSYVAQNIGRSSEEAENSLEFLRTQLPAVQQDLANAEAELNDYRLKHESINLDLESASVLERVVELDTQISQLSLEETELSRLFTRDHPQYQSLLSKRKKLLDEKQSLAATVKSFPETQQEILRRTRNVEVNQQIYLQLLNKKQELNVLKASAVGSVRIIDNAVPHPIPVSPNKRLTMMMCSMLGLLLGCGIVLLRFFLLRNVDSPEDISKMGLPVYATVPFSSSQDNQSPDGYILSRDNPAELTVEALRSLRTSLHFGMLENGKGIVSVTGPSPALGKSFVSANLAYLAAESGSRVLLIDADMRRGTVGQIFQIASGTAGLSELLAGAAELEEVVHPVALANKQSLSKQEVREVSVSNREPELEAVLEGIKLMDSPSKMADNDIGTGAGLSVISRGKAPPNPSELLMQEGLPVFLKQMSDHYDLIVLDTPPVLAVTDAMIVGRYADMNLMVVRHNQTTIHELEEVVKTFKINKVDLSGVILNGYDHKKGKFGQYGYSYGYQYNYESD